MTGGAAAVCAALWAAATYRVVLAVRGPTRPRTLLAVAMIAMAATATAHFAGPTIDAAMKVPNIASLAARLALLISLTSLRLWAWTIEASARPLSRARIGVTLAMAAVTAAAWALSPLHQETVTDHAHLDQTPALLTYTVGLYLFIAWIAIELGVFAARRARSIRRQDPPAAFALSTITFAAATGTIVMLAFSVHVALAALGYSSTAFATIGRVLMPLTLVAAGVGLLTVPLTRSISASRDLVRVTPAWRASPDTVRMDSRRFLAPDTVLTRRLIEIHDGDQEVPVLPDDSLDQHRLSSATPSAGADLIGRILSPFPVLIALICWTAAATSANLAAAARWAALTAGLIVGVPFAALMLLRASGRITDRQVVHRSQRHLLLAIALLSTAAAAAALWVLNAPRQLSTLVVVMLALLTVMAALTPWKPSLHTAVGTGAVIALTQLHGPLALALTCALPLIAWARVRSGRHTVAQVIAGALLGAAIPLVALAVLP